MPASRSFALSSSAPQQSSPFYKKHKMSLTQTYYLAHTARSKLSREAARPEYNLRVLVGHANLLDGLMIELADAEREQETWFNESVRRAESTTASSPSKATHITWAESLPAVVEEDSDESSSDESDASDDDMLDVDEPVVTRRRAPSPHYASITEMEVDSEEDSEDEDDVAEDEESDSDELALTRSASRSTITSPPDSPPELLHELETSDEEEEDSHQPPSPPTETFPASHLKGGKHSQHKMTVSLKQDDAWQMPTGNARPSHVSELYI